MADDESFLFDRKISTTKKSPSPHHLPLAEGRKKRSFLVREVSPGNRRPTGTSLGWG